MSKKIKYIKFGYRSTMSVEDIDSFYILLNVTATNQVKVQNRFKFALGCLMAAMYESYSQGVELSIPSEERHYLYNHGRYNPHGVSANIVRKLIAKLIEHGFLIKTTDYSYLPSGGGHTRLYQATFKFVELVDKPKPNPEWECIRIKSKTNAVRTSLVDYTDTPYLEKSRKQLTNYNNFISQFDIKGLNSVQYLKDRKIVNCKLQTIAHRCFTDDATKGGRYAYGGISHLSMPRAFRSEILIGGYPVVEYDYTALHVFMAYHTLKINYSGADPYLDVFGIKDNHLRKIVKKCLLISFNIEFDRTFKRSRGNAIIAVKKDLEGDYQTDIKEGIDAIHYNDVLARHCLTIKDIFLKIEEHHQPIREFFYSGCGSRFQHKDSEIMSAILLDFQVLNIPALSVHDSVIVRRDIDPFCVIGILQTAYFCVYKNFIKVTSAINTKIQISESEVKQMDSVQKIIKEFMPHSFYMAYSPRINSTDTNWRIKVVRSEYSWKSKNRNSSRLAA